MGQWIFLTPSFLETPAEKIADLMQPICFYFFIDKHLQKYHPRDILII